MIEGVRVGVVILPELRWTEARDQWTRAEQLGFDHAWTYDHLAWRTLRDSPWFSALPVLTAAAAVTTRIRLGPLVASPNFRHPVPFAKEVMTLDDLSNGRLTLGLGAGGIGWDATILGHAAWSADERADRFAEFVEVTDLLLREPAASYRGRYYSADEARTYPGCMQRPRVPFAVAVAGPRGMRLAAKLADTWVTTGPHRTEERLGAEDGARVVREQITDLEEACAEDGRDPASIGRLVLTGPALDPGTASAGSFEDTLGRYASVGVTDLVVHWPRPTEPYAADLATFERVVTR